MLMKICFDLTFNKIIWCREIIFAKCFCKLLSDCFNHSLQKTHFDNFVTFAKKRYIMTYAREQKNFRLFIQDIFCHVKTAKIKFVYNQLIMIWNNMNWKFRRDIPKSISNIKIRKFLKQFDFKSNIWFDMTKRIDD